MEIIGWLGSILFAICAIPQAWQSYCQGHSRGVSPYFLAVWLGGEVLTIAYVVATLGAEGLPLLVNYVGNLGCLLVIIYYYLRPRSSEEELIDEAVRLIEEGGG